MKQVCTVTINLTWARQKLVLTAIQTAQCSICEKPSAVCTMCGDSGWLEEHYLFALAAYRATPPLHFIDLWESLFSQNFGLLTDPATLWIKSTTHYKNCIDIWPNLCSSRSRDMTILIRPHRYCLVTTHFFKGLPVGQLPNDHLQIVISQLPINGFSRVIQHYLCRSWQLRE